MDNRDGPHFRTHGPRYHNEYYLSYTVDEEDGQRGHAPASGHEPVTVTGAINLGTFDYTQGLVSTSERFTFTHGYVEIRAKFPGGKGLWPCLADAA